jgi:hypothetical protein
MAQAERLRLQARLEDLTFVGDGDSQKRARWLEDPYLTGMASWRKGDQMRRRRGERQEDGCEAVSQKMCRYVFYPEALKR